MKQTKCAEKCWKQFLLKYDILRRTFNCWCEDWYFALVKMGLCFRCCHACTHGPLRSASHKRMWNGQVLFVHCSFRTLSDKRKKLRLVTSRNHSDTRSEFFSQPRSRTWHRLLSSACLPNWNLSQSAIAHNFRLQDYSWNSSHVWIWFSTGASFRASLRYAVSNCWRHGSLLVEGQTYVRDLLFYLPLTADEAGPFPHLPLRVGPTALRLGRSCSPWDGVGPPQPNAKQACPTLSQDKLGPAPSPKNRISR